MSDIKNLTSSEAIEKLKELLKDADVCMFITSLTKLPLNSRPMSTSQVDDEGNIWFMSRSSSDKNTEIAMDKRVQLFYSTKNSAEFVSVYGEAEIVRDKEKAKEIWTPIAKAWFEEGVDDPELTLIKVVPQDSYYWDTKNNKLVALIKYAASAITGKHLDDGIEGKIRI